MSAETLGQVAFMAYYGLQIGAAVSMPDSWNMQSEQTRADWEGCARAVVDRYLSEQFKEE